MGIPYDNRGGYHSKYWIPCTWEVTLFLDYTTIEGGGKTKTKQKNHLYSLSLVPFQGGKSSQFVSQQNRYA